MDVAILMSTYNGETYIDAQMKSICDQVIDGHITVYVRDDGSTDNTIDILTKWKDHIELVLYQEDNIGPAMSFWKLFMNDQIQADYYAFCDQDDVWDLDKIQKGVDAIRDCQGGALWCSNCRLIDQDGNIVRDQMYTEAPDFSIISQLVCGTTQGCAMIFNNRLRGCIKSFHIADIPMHDFVVMTYAIARGTVIYDSSPSFNYRVHENNVVANEGKGRCRQIKDSLNHWFSQTHRNELSRYAAVLLQDNAEYLDDNTKNYISNIVQSRDSLAARIKIIFDEKTTSQNKRAERSFKIRTLLGVI